MGLPIGRIIYEICGGVLDDQQIKGVQTGGPSGGVIPEKHLDTPVSYESLQALGSIMGSGGMLVMDENDSMVDVAKFYLKFCVDESCGKCAPCRVGGYQMLQLLEKIFRGAATRRTSPPCAASATPCRPPRSAGWARRPPIGPFHPPIL